MKLGFGLLAILTLGWVTGDGVPARRAGTAAWQVSESGQNFPGQLGMVWERPEDAIRAAADLRAMADLGIRAVRTQLWTDDLLFDLADTLGILVFQDLPVAAPTTPVLTDSLDYLLREVRRLSAAGRVYSVGLAYAPQSTDPETCRLLLEMTRSAGPGLRTHIVSGRGADDPCAESVDQVLYGGFLQWRRVPPGVAMAELGSPASDAEGQDQAALLGDELPARLKAGGWTFLYRWADVGGTDAFQPSPMGRHWGLHRLDGASRSGVAVVQLLTSRGQDVFDRPPSDASPPESAGYVLVGWLTLLALLAATLIAPRMRPMAVRYFMAHGIYRAAVQEGRDALLLANGIVLLVFSMLTGVVGQMVLWSNRSHPSVFALWLWLPPESRTAADGLLTSPFWAAFMFSALALTVALLWLGVLYAVAARRYGGTLAQVVTLSVWPRWPVVAAIPPIMLAGTDVVGPALVTWVAAWVGITSLWAVVRTNMDVSRVMRLRPVPLLLLWALSPLTPLGVLALIAVGGSHPALTYLAALTG